VTRKCCGLVYVVSSSQLMMLSNTQSTTLLISSQTKWNEDVRRPSMHPHRTSPTLSVRANDAFQAVHDIQAVLVRPSARQVAVQSLLICVMRRSISVHFRLTKEGHHVTTDQETIAGYE